MKKIILTGFEPFGSYEHNPVQDSTQRFDGIRIGNCDVIGVVLRCTYKSAFDALKKVMDATEPAAIVSTGLASSVQGIRFETTGRNMMNGKYPDADGYEPKGVAILPGEDEFVAAHCDAAALANRLLRRGIPTEVSEDAEGFVCNALLYLTSHHIDTHALPTRNTFIHVPWTDTYRDRLTLEPGKITIAEEALHDAIEQIIRSISEE